MHCKEACVILAQIESETKLWKVEVQRHKVKWNMANSKLGSTGWVESQAEAVNAIEGAIKQPERNNSFDDINNPSRSLSQDLHPKACQARDGLCRAHHFSTNTTFSSPTSTLSASGTQHN